MRYKIIISIIGVLLLAVLALRPTQSVIPTPETVVASSSVSASSSSPSTIQTPDVISQKDPVVAQPTAASSFLHATLEVASSSYQLSFSNGDTLESAMHALASSSPNFAFRTRDFPGLGAFVESINGTAAANGYNWTLYINNHESEKGISSVILSPGDVVRWSYEKRYY